MRSSIVSADGTRWALRSVHAGDRGAILRWRNEPAIRAAMANPNPIGSAEHRAWFERALTASDMLVTVFEINDEPSGLMQLTRIDAHDRNARWGFYLRPGSHRPGSGSRMGFLILRHAFDELRLHRVYADVIGSNEPSLRMHRNLGFRHEGIQREQVLRDGAWLDLVLFGMLADEFDERRAMLERKLFQ